MRSILPLDAAPWAIRAGDILGFALVGEAREQAITYFAGARDGNKAEFLRVVVIDVLKFCERWTRLADLCAAGAKMVGSSSVPDALRSVIARAVRDIDASQDSYRALAAICAAEALRAALKGDVEATLKAAGEAIMYRSHADAYQSLSDADARYAKTEFALADIGRQAGDAKIAKYAEWLEALRSILINEADRKCA